MPLMKCVPMALGIDRRDLPNRVTTSWLFVSFGEQGMGLLPATLGIGSDWTRWRLLRHLLPRYPAPAAWRLSQLAPRLTKSDDDPQNDDAVCVVHTSARDLY